MSLQELIRSRRTVGAFTPQSVDPELVASLLDSAIYAPNHRMTQPWRFVFIQGEGVKQYANLRAEMTPVESARPAAYEKFAGVPFYLVVVMKRSTNPEIAEEDQSATAALVQNFLLLAHDAGLGTAWKTFKPDQRLRDFAGIAHDEQVIAMVQVGYSAEPPRAGERTPIRDRITVIE